MKIAILKEKAFGETRVAITPDVAKLFVRDGFEIYVEKNAGLSAGLKIYDSGTEVPGF